MCCSESGRDDNVLFATFEETQQISPEWRKALIVMNVFNVMKRRRNPNNTGNGTGRTDSPDQTNHVRRKSSRLAVTRKKNSVPENTNGTMDNIEAVSSTLSHQLKLSGDSTVYKDKRDELLVSEHKLFWNDNAKRRASKVEIQANAIVYKIREYERTSPEIFGNVPGEAVPDPEKTRDMGDRFLVNKPQIDRSKIYDMAHQMPKGAHLHLHFNSELQAELLLPHARKLEDTMFIRSTRALCTDEDFDSTEIVFSVLPKETKQGNIFSADYDPDWKAPSTAAWMRWVDFRQQFPKSYECLKEYNKESAEAEILDNVAELWAREKMVITLDHAYNSRQTTNGAWACFNQGTRAFKGLMNYESVYRWYIGKMIDSMINDKVMYAEVRPMLMDKSIPTDDGVGKLMHTDQMRIICEEVKKKQAELKKKGLFEKFPFGMRVIYSTPRSIPRARMQVELEDCLKLKLQHPDIICGFDLVGAEDRPNHIGFYADMLVAFTNACNELNVKIPFMFHAGETLLDTGGSKDPDNSNLYDSLLLNAKRIGHGYSLLKHPLLVEKYKKQNICLELCPISNELLHLCGNAKEHIFPELLAAGLPCSLNADNPSLFRGSAVDSSSLSYEFYQVMVGDTRMDLHGWKQLAEWSLEHSCLTEEEHSDADRIFAREWEEFCQWVVDQYGEFAAGLDEPK